MSSQILDSREEIVKIDVGNVLGSVEELPNQCWQAWEEANKVAVPEEYLDVDNVVMCGMGGSGLGARVIDSVYAEQLRKPLIQVHEYHLPGFVNERTLVICSSYSGETEETIANARQAIEKKAKWMAIGTGNTLIELAKSKNVPYYQINPKFNPSNQPRMAIGYSIVGQLVLAAKAGLITISSEEIGESIAAMEKVKSNNSIDCRAVPAYAGTPRNDGKGLAKQLALKMRDKMVIFVSAEHLVGSAHIFSNQQSENAKNLSIEVQIPELNHHLMEGLKHPSNNPKNLLFIFIDSELYPTRVRQRVNITKEVVEKNRIESLLIQLLAETKLAQAFELIQLGGFADFYLAVLYGQDPAPIPWVDYFKTRLGQPLGK